LHVAPLRALVVGIKEYLARGLLKGHMQTALDNIITSIKHCNRYMSTIAETHMTQAQMKMYLISSLDIIVMINVWIGLVRVFLSSREDDNKDCRGEFEESGFVVVIEGFEGEGGTALDQGC
jgi:hypothetical protein